MAGVGGWGEGISPEIREIGKNKDTDTETMSLCYREKKDESQRETDIGGERYIGRQKHKVQNRCFLIENFYKKEREHEGAHGLVPGPCSVGRRV